MELPLSKILAEMEITGIRVDASRLHQMKGEFAERLHEIEQKIYQEAGEEFNLNSPKQLGVILFEKMGLPVIKKTKTGYSTAVDVLGTVEGTGTDRRRHFDLSSNCQNPIHLCGRTA